MTSAAFRPREYQTDMVDQVIAYFRAGIGAVCMQVGTGAGKTATASFILERLVARKQRGLFIAHLDTLVEDTHARLVAAGVHAGFVQAGRPSDPTAPVQVASLQTLLARGERPPAHLLIPDECHRVLSAGYRGLLEAYPDSAILGLTATPQRGDGKPLGKLSGGVFERLVCGPSNRWLTDRGYLVPVDVISPPRFSERGLVDDPVDSYRRLTPGQRAIFFASNVAHAEALRRKLEEAGVPCALIVGDTPRAERRRLRFALESGELLALVGVAVFLEGWDVPSIETIVLARAFTVCGGWLQAIGRGLRPSPATGKTRLLVHDLRGAFNLHGLPDEDRVWSLEGKAVRRAETMTAIGRCKDCFAVFRPVSRCPRCGAPTRGEPKIPRVLTRAEKAANVSKLPPSERDRRYLEQLTRAAYRLGYQNRAATAWALSQFRKRWNREPECHLGGGAS